MNDEKKEKECKLYYKTFNGDLACKNGFQYEVGKTYTIEEGTELKMCENGFHCCEFALNCIEYYGPTSRFCEVQIGSNYITQNGKTVTDSITILRELKREEIDELLTGNVGSQVDCKRRYLKGRRQREHGTSHNKNFCEDEIDITIYSRKTRPDGISRMMGLLGNQQFSL